MEVPAPVFLRQRGTAGRTPALLDVNLRASLRAEEERQPWLAAEITIDLLHIGSQRKPVDYDQVHYFSVDENGNQADPNPTWMASQLRTSHP